MKQPDKQACFTESEIWEQCSTGRLCHALQVLVEQRAFAWFIDETGDFRNAVKHVRQRRREHRFCQLAIETHVSNIAFVVCYDHARLRIIKVN